MIIVMQTSADLRRSDQAACRVAPSVIDKCRRADVGVRQTKIQARQRVSFGNLNGGQIVNDCE